MPLDQDNDFRLMEHYRALTELQLPGPSVVIDVRQGGDHDPPLIWNLAVELDDLTAEMQLNQVTYWRHLNECIDLLKLKPFRADQPEQTINSIDFILTMRNGDIEPLKGRDALVDELGRNHLDRVRNNRIGAARDKGKAVGDFPSAPAQPEQTTVRVFFIVDADDQDSLTSAAAYAQWLKYWNHEYEEQGRSGRDRRLSTLAICLNTDPHRQYAHSLKFLMQAPDNRSALDTVILMHIYGDDEAFLSPATQAYQLESILSLLLLLSQENFAEEELALAQDLHPTLDFYRDDEDLPFTPPFSIYMMGISSLEYSTRWGTRWLDYGLVAKVIEIMQDTDGIYQKASIGRLRREVREQLNHWQQSVQEIVPGSFVTMIPEFRCLDEIQGHLQRFSAESKRGISLQSFDEFCKRILQSYRGDGYTLESAVETAPLVFSQAKKDYMQYMQASPNALDDSSPYEGYLQLLSLRAQAAQFPVALFQEVRGSLQRVLSQMNELGEAIEDLRTKTEKSFDIQEFYEKARLQIQRERVIIESNQKAPRGLFGRKHSQQSEQAVGKIIAFMRDQLTKIAEVIAVKVALGLLQDVGLYNPARKIPLYTQQIKHFIDEANTAQREAARQQESAYERLTLSMSETQVGISQKSVWLNLNSRKDLLDWEQIVQAFKKLSDVLEFTPTSLELLAKWLLRLLSGENPAYILQQYFNKEKEQQRLSTPDEEIKVQHQALSTMLVCILLLFDTISLDVNTIQPLLNQYLELKDRSAQAPSALEDNILGLQRIVKESMLGQTMYNNQAGKNFSGFNLKQELPIERVLAAWVNSQYANVPSLRHALGQQGILARLQQSKISPVQALDDLRERNRVLGYRETMSGEDRFYLLLPPGELGSDFLKELDLLYSTQIRPIRFPNIEKIMYFHIHRVHQVLRLNTPSKQVQINQES